MTPGERTVAPYGVPFMVEGRRFLRERIFSTFGKAEQDARANAKARGYRVLDVVSNVQQQDGTYIVELEIAGVPCETCGSTDPNRLTHYHPFAATNE